MEVDQIEDITLNDVLAGLAYIMEYRISGGRYPHLDITIMRRLAKALLDNMSKQEKGVMNRKFTEEADLAYRLFAEFLEEGVSSTLKWPLSCGARLTPHFDFFLPQWKNSGRPLLKYLKRI